MKEQTDEVDTGVQERLMPSTGRDEGENNMKEATTVFKAITHACGSKSFLLVSPRWQLSSQGSVIDTCENSIKLA